jgi:hypothetical protein
MSKQKDNPHRHYIWGENRIHHPEHEFIIKMSHPRLYIRYRLEDSMFAGFDEFFSSIADVQWMDGKDSIPDKQEQHRIFTEAWNYLCLEERRLEEDMDAMEDEDDF